MPSHGNPVQRFRLRPEEYEEIEEAIERRNTWSRESPWTFSDFFRIAIREKLLKMGRCRRPRRKPVRPLDSSGAIP
jgi:hypothetical protein